MRTVKKDLTNTKIIKNSKFIAYVFHIDDEESFPDILETIKTKHPKRRHCCYAFRFGDKEAYSDDGEPSGTGGSRILEFLKLKELDLILVIVIRYFGGVKLGTGPLAKAYQETANEVLIDENLSSFTKSLIIEIEVSYEELDKIKRVYSENIITESFQESVILRLNLPIELMLEFPYKYETIKKSYFIPKEKAL